MHGHVLVTVQDTVCGGGKQRSSLVTPERRGLLHGWGDKASTGITLDTRCCESSPSSQLISSQQPNHRPDCNHPGTACAEQQQSKPRINNHAVPPLNPVATNKEIPDGLLCMCCGLGGVDAQRHERPLPAATPAQMLDWQHTRGH